MINIWQATLTKAGVEIRLNGVLIATQSPQDCRMLGDYLHTVAGDAFLRPYVATDKDRKTGEVVFHGDQFDRRWPEGAQRAADPEPPPAPVQPDPPPDQPPPAGGAEAEEPPPPTRPAYVDR